MGLNDRFLVTLTDGTCGPSGPQGPLCSEGGPVMTTAPPAETHPQEERELVTRLIMAAAVSGRRLTQEEVDALLGIDVPTLVS